MGIGLLNNKVSRFDLSFTVDTTPDYSAGDVIDGLKTISDCVRVGCESGKVCNALLFNDVAHAIDVDLVFFGENPSNSTFTDNSAVDVDVADIDKIIGVMNLTRHIDLGTPSVSLPAIDDCGFCFSLSPNSDGQSVQDMYVVAVARGTINFAATTDLVGAVFIEHD